MAKYLGTFPPYEGADRDFAVGTEAGYNNLRGEENENADSCFSICIPAICL